MVVKPRLQNTNKLWVATLRPRVGDVVGNGLGGYFTNMTGYNDLLTNSAVWFPNQPTAIPIVKNAGNVNPSGGDFVIDLSANAMPAFPVAMAVYVDLAGTGAWAPVSPVNYNPVSHILAGMNDPTAFPSQVVRVYVQ